MVDKDTRVQIENDCYTLQFKMADSKAKDVKKHWVTDGYFPDMVSALNSWAKNAPARLGDAQHTLQEVKESWETCKKRVEQLLKV